MQKGNVCFFILISTVLDDTEYITHSDDLPKLILEIKIKTEIIDRQKTDRQIDDMCIKCQSVFHFI